MPFIYPTSYELRQIEPELVQRGSAGRVGIELLPIQSVNAAKVRWSQQDNYFGLQHLRGMDGQPTHVNRVGQKTFEYEPGVFGEFIDITEQELTIRAGSVDVSAVPINVQDLVVDAQRQLIARELDRIESSNWTLLTTGTIKIDIAGPQGVMIGYSDTYVIQTFTAAIPWSTIATATPARNFQSVQQLALGKSVDLGSGATAYMNSVTANNLLNNTNASDLAGRRIGSGGTFNSLNDINQFLLGQNLPKVQVYDEGYVPAAPGGIAGTFKKFIPDNLVVVIGRRTSGARLGQYITTRNASNNFQPGSYQYTIDRANGVLAEKRTPANIEIHRGHNGGPTIFYPSAVVVMNV
jgi:hypothetical protein